MKKTVLAVAIILMSINFYSCTPESVLENDQNSEQLFTNGEETSDPEEEEDND